MLEAGPRPVMLTVAGSDSGGGAGIQADIKTAMAHGVYAASVVTAVTAQNTVAVSAVQPVAPGLVAAQLRAVFEDLPVVALKVGLLAEPETVAVLADAIHRWSPAVVVVDPVGSATVGGSLQAPGTVAAMVEHLFPLTTVLTPNLDEGASLYQRMVQADPSRGGGLSVDRGIRDESELSRLAVALLALGPRYVLAKGGHLGGSGGSGAAEAVDVLASAERSWRWSAPRIEGLSGHGTGCTLASAIAARVALGEAIPEAVGGAKRYLTAALAASSRRRLGRGVGPLDHLDAT